MDNETRYFVVDIPVQDIPFREQLLEHLVLFNDILGGQGARSLMSAPILLYAVGEANRRNNTVSNGEAIPQWITSFTLSFNHIDVNYNIRIHREHLEETLGETFWICSTPIDETFLRDDIINLRLSNNELGQAQHQIRLTLNDIERDYLNTVRSDEDIINVLGGPQGRSYLDIQVISNFFQVIQQLR